MTRVMDLSFRELLTAVHRGEENVDEAREDVYAVGVDQKSGIDWAVSLHSSSLSDTS